MTTHIWVYINLGSASVLAYWESSHGQKLEVICCESGYFEQILVKLESEIILYEKKNNLKYLTCKYFSFYWRLDVLKTSGAMDGNYNLIYIVSDHNWEFWMLYIHRLHINLHGMAKWYMVTH